LTDMEYIHTVTRLTDRDHERLVRHYLELRPEERIAVHRLHTRISQKRRNQKDPSHAAAFFHATFLLAIREYRLRQNPSLSKRMTKKEADQIDALRAISGNARPPRKASAAQALVEQNYDFIKTLRDKQPRPESWRKIAKKLSGNGQKISHTGLIDIYETIDAEGGP